jgi:small-conductance mechanosensitive channel
MRLKSVDQVRLQEPDNQEGAMKKLLILAAIGEVLTGLILLTYPLIAVRLLIGEELTGAGVVASRVAGISLISLGVACWPESSTLRAFYGMLTYSTIVMLYLAFLGIGGVAGILLWPAVAAHAALSAALFWAFQKQRKAPGRSGSNEGHRTQTHKTAA